MSVGLSLRRLIPQGLKNFLRQQTPAWRLSSRLSPFLPEVVCVDVGAAYYPHSKWLQFLNSPRTRWLAVEPNEKNLSYVKSWVWPAAISTCTTGLSATGGRQTLYVTNVDTGSSLLPPEIPDSMRLRVTNLDYFFPVREVAIDTLTLAQATASMPGQVPVFVKLDTQGTELSILKGAQELFDQQRILGIEIESTLLAHPLMKGSGKFWQVCEFLETQGFELLLLKPIHSIPRSGRAKKQVHTYLNECDGVFAMRQDIVLKQPADRRASLLAFYITNLLYEDAALMLETDKPLADYLASQGCEVAKLLGQLSAAI
jgi:FkbM family methyltransferase